MGKEKANKKVSSHHHKHHESKRSEKDSKERHKRKHKRNHENDPSDSDGKIERHRKHKRSHKDHDVKKQGENIKELSEVQLAIQEEALLKLANQERAIENAVREKRRRLMAPISHTDHVKQESKINRVFDNDTGRWRLVKGSGEIVEEIVSKDQQRIINKMATL
eukprot:Ihof_evm4s283 gene=Ihof_evmTU4s283